MAQKHTGTIVALLTDLVMPGMVYGLSLARGREGPAAQGAGARHDRLPEGLQEPDGSLKPGVHLLAKLFTRMALGEKLEEMLRISGMMLPRGLGA